MSTLPPLSPPDAALLTRYLRASENLDTLLDQPDPPSLLDLLSFLSRPDIRPWTDFYTHLQARALRRAAINTLLTCLTNSPDPTHLRLTAVALLNHTRPAPRAADLASDRPLLPGASDEFGRIPALRPSSPACGGGVRRGSASLTEGVCERGLRTESVSGAIPATPCEAAASGDDAHLNALNTAIPASAGPPDVATGGAEAGAAGRSETRGHPPQDHTAPAGRRDFAHAPAPPPHPMPLPEALRILDAGAADDPDDDTHDALEDAHLDALEDAETQAAADADPLLAAALTGKPEAITTYYLERTGHSPDPDLLHSLSRALQTPIGPAG